MQAVKDKLHDMNEMRKAKAEAKAEEKAEKDIAKARMEVAHEVRLAKEAEAAMGMHVAKAGQKVEREAAKHEPKQPDASGVDPPADQTDVASGNSSAPAVLMHSADRADPFTHSARPFPN